MAETIRITPQELRDGATYLEGRKVEVMDLLGQMNNKVQEVCGNWEGAAQNAFFETFTNLYNQISQTLPQTVEGIEDMMNGAANGIEQADEQIASSLKM